MPVDFWTKMALTLIAVSLAVIAWKLPVADVGHAQMGSASSAPCYIANNSNDALKVRSSTHRTSIEERSAAKGDMNGNVKAAGSHAPLSGQCPR
jgi:hypothetical protein